MSAKLRSIINFGKVIKWKYLILAQIFCINLISGFANVPPVSAASCSDVEFIFARGSGEPLNGKSYSEWKKEIEARLAGEQLTYKIRELGDDPHSAHQYPAVAITGEFYDYVTMIDAYFSAGEAFRFGASVEQGRQELLDYVSKTSAQCQNTKYVLGGYSQGAMLMTTVLSKLPADKIIYVTNFGDPKIFLPEGEHVKGLLLQKAPDACRGQKLSEYRAYVPDCWAYEGMLGGQNPYRSREYYGKIGTWCNKGDFLCSSKFVIEDHSHYVEDGLYADAASKIYQKLKSAFPSKFPQQQAKSLHDVLFLLDSTGSMENLWKAYREELRAMARQVFRAGGRVAAYGYKDSLSERSSWAFCDFGCDEEKFISRSSLYLAMDGGDVNESLLSAAYLAMGELDWQWGATKSIVVVTDAGYHAKDYQDVDLPQVIARSLSIDPVNIYVIAPEQLADTYAELTSQTNGKFFGLKKLSEENASANQSIMQSLTAEVLNRPVAKLGLSEYSGLIGDEMTFDASESYSQNGKKLSYEWDLDGDGVFESQPTGATVTKQYDQVFDGYIQVRVSDGEKSSTMSAHVNIQQKFAAPVEITDLSYTSTGSGAYDVTFATDAPEVMLSINDAPLGFVKSSTQATRNNVTTFPVKDVTQNSTLLLTPYSAEGRKGIGRSVTITVEPSKEPTDDDNNHPTQDPDGGNQPTPPASKDPEPTTDSKTEPGQATPSHPGQGSQTVIPSAPNLSPRVPTVQVNQRPAPILKAPKTGAYDTRLALIVGQPYDSRHSKTSAYNPKLMPVSSKRALYIDPKTSTCDSQLMRQEPQH